MPANALKGREANAPSQTLLRVRGVSMRFGGVVALDDVSFDVAREEICGLIGPNGSGKTTLFNCISGIYRTSAGEIELDGHALTGLRPHRIARLGIGRTFQNLAVFGSMSVRDNVLAGAHGQRAGGFFSDLFALPGHRREELVLQRGLSDLLTFLDLVEVAGQPVATLPFPVQKRVELARALASRPKILLLDEPASGLSHGEVDALCDTIRSIQARHRLTMLVVEHHMNLVMRVSDRIVALDFGRKIAEGPPATVQSHPDVIRGYLGKVEDVGAS